MNTIIRVDNLRKTYGKTIAVHNISFHVMKGRYWVSNATPIWYVIQLLQEPWLGYGWQMNASLIVLGITAAATLLSARFFRWE